MSAVIVDWLGRGGIAQCTEAWAMELSIAKIEVVVVTRPGRELGSGMVAVESAPAHANRIAAHRAVAVHAAKVVSRERPEVVIVQNYVIPVLEAPVYEAARRVGAHLVTIIHDQRLHSRWAGSAVGLRSLVRKADTVLAHSVFVADVVRAKTDRPVEAVPLPVPVGLLAGPEGPLPFARPENRLLAIHFGVLHRSYKGTSTVVELAAAAPPAWGVAVVGVGAPTGPGLVTVDRFVAPGELVASIRAADAVVLPYRFATQSAAVLLAQVLGVVPLASAVGGIPEQIIDGKTGRLLAPDATVSVWWAALAELADPATRQELATRAQEHAWAEHGLFRSRALELCDGT